MTFHTVLKKIGAVSFACGGFWLAVTPFARPAAAQTTAPSCPGIFYREPFTSRVSAPAGCPLTEYQQRLQEPGVDDLGVGDSDQADTLEELQSSGGERVTPGAPVGSSVPPLPEERSDAIAIASPVDNQLSVLLTNDTGAIVTYEVIGDTSRRILMMGESDRLQGVPLPATITVVRQDEGLLDVVAESSETGILEFSLTPEASLDDTQGVIRIQADGQVFVN